MPQNRQNDRLWMLLSVLQINWKLNLKYIVKILKSKLTNCRLDINWFPRFSTATKKYSTYSFSCSKRTMQLHQSWPKLANERPCTYSGAQAAQQSRYKVLSMKNGYILELNKYIPLTNWVRGLYWGLRTEFFPHRFMAQARSARAINRRGKKRGSVTHSTDRENEVSKIFIISLLCVWRIRERFLFTRNGFKFLLHLESKTSQFEIVV